MYTNKPEPLKEKISMFSRVREQVNCIPDLNNKYEVLLKLFKYKFAEFFAERLILDEINYDLLFIIK